VGGRKVDRPSYEVEPGEVITLKPDAPVEPAVRTATELGSRVPAWLLADHDGLTGRVERLPARHEIDAPVTEQLIVELYSR
jgi:small subunit ribosomal protein S4